MVVDTDIFTWVLEFLLRQPMVPDDVIANLLVNSGNAVGKNNPCLKKALLLRSMKSDIGPSFIEAATEGESGLKEKVHGDDPKDQTSKLLVAADRHASQAKGTGKRGLPRKPKHAISHKRHKGPAKLIDSEEAETDTNSTKCNILSTPEINKVQDALNTSSKELQALVKDPLPDALHLSGHIMDGIGKAKDSSTSGLAQKHLYSEPEVDNHSREGVDASNPSSSNAAEGGNGLPLRSEPKNNVPKPSLMQRNSSACAFEWDDSVDGSPERTNGMNRIHLDSPRELNVLPVSMYKPQKNCQKKEYKRWSLEEEDALREGVQKFGVGNWKLILKSKNDIFAERTEVNLKDKWRNLTKYD